jgi:hypothetical protein
MKRLAFLVGAGALLAACDVPNPPPVVASFNEASVEIQQEAILQPSRPDDPAVVSEAQRICATAGRRAEYASTRMVTSRYQTTAAHLFLCLRR